MAQDESDDFLKLVVKELNEHVDNYHYRLVPIKSVPEDINNLPSVWSMQKKRNFITNDITKYN